MMFLILQLLPSWSRHYVLEDEDVKEEDSDRKKPRLALFSGDEEEEEEDLTWRKRREIVSSHLTVAGNDPRESGGIVEFLSARSPSMVRLREEHRVSRRNVSGGYGAEVLWTQWNEGDLALHSLRESFSFQLVYYTQLRRLLSAPESYFPSSYL